MYCGDETGSFIGDVGSSQSRFGYGGEDTPKYVVPSYCCATGGGGGEKDTADPNNKRNTKYSIPSSCYSRRWVDAELKSSLRHVDMAGSPSSSASSSAAYDPYHYPITDPTCYLQQGDSIQNWDAYEALWQSALDVMAVRQRYKHTVGGHGNDGGGDHVDATITTATGGVPSTSLRPKPGESSSNHAKFVHPVLAVTPGFTHRMSGTSTDAESGGGLQQQHQLEYEHRKEMVRLTEFFMETLDCQALFVAPTPMLAAFSHGRQTCLHMDVGAGGCRVTPVVDGLILKKSQRRSGRGRDWISNCMWQGILAQQSKSAVLLRPRYQVASHSTATTSTTTATIPIMGRGIFHRWAMLDLFYELETSGCWQLAKFRSTSSSTTTKDKSARKPRVFFSEPDDDEMLEVNDDNNSNNKKTDESPTKNNDNKDGTEQMDVEESKKEQEDKDDASAASSSASTTSTNSSSSSSRLSLNDTTYELPDKTLIDLTSRLGKDLCRSAELLFTEPELLPTFCLANDNSLLRLQQHVTLSNQPLHKLIYDSLTAVPDVDVRKDLAANMVLTGAGSLLPNLPERLSWELPQLMSAAFKCKVIASPLTVERAHAAWIGGSILSSLGSFQQLWLSQTEYEEYGATLACQRFP